MATLTRRGRGEAGGGTEKTMAENGKEWECPSDLIQGRKVLYDWR